MTVQWRRGFVLAICMGLMAISMSSCCRMRSVLVIDERGEPVTGAFLYTQSFKYIGPWCMSAAVTDEHGKARILLHGEPTVLRAGYYSYTDGDDIAWRVRDRVPPVKPRVFVLHERAVAEPPVIHELGFDVLIQGSKSEEHDLPKVLELGVDLTFSFLKSQFTAKAMTGALLGSDRFYFTGARDELPAATLVARDMISFYVLDHEDRPTHKVSAHVSGRSTRRVDDRSLHAVTVRVLWCEVDSIDDRVEPGFGVFEDEGQHPGFRRRAADALSIPPDDVRLMVSENKHQLAEVIESEVSRVAGKELATRWVEVLTHRDLSGAD